MDLGCGQSKRDFASSLSFQFISLLLEFLFVFLFLGLDWSTVSHIIKGLGFSLDLTMYIWVIPSSTSYPHFYMICLNSLKCLKIRVCDDRKPKTMSIHNIESELGMEWMDFSVSLYPSFRDYTYHDVIALQLTRAEPFPRCWAL